MNRVVVPAVIRTIGIFALVAGLGAIWSCQNTDSEPASEPQDEQVAFQVGKSFREPDQVTWDFKGGTGVAKISLDPKTNLVTARFTLPVAPVTDSVHLSVWRYGLRFVTLSGIGAGNLVVSDSSLRHEEPSQSILMRHDSLAALDPVFYERNPLGVRRAYAKLLLDGDTLVKGYPGRKPYGLDSAALVDEICVAMARRKAPFASQLPVKFLGLDSAKWHAVVLERIANGSISSVDSARLFPPAPVRVLMPISVKSHPVAGGDEVEIRGTFGWNPGLVVVGATVFDGKDAVVGGFDVSVPQPSKDVDTIWKLDGKASLRARARTAPGLYFLQLTARDAKGNLASSRDSFRVDLPAPGTPRLVRILPVSQDSTVLPFDSTVVRVQVKLLNPGEIDTASFRINGAVAQKLSDSVFQALVPLAPNGAPQFVTMKVSGKNGLVGSDYLVATRLRDTVSPSIAAGASANSRTVPFDSMSVFASWSATDNHKIGLVAIGDSVVAALGSSYGRDVRLAVGENIIRVYATDSTGNRSRDSIRITRLPDRTSPAIQLALGNQDRVVTADSVRALVAWTVADNHKVARVDIGDSLAFGGGGLYYRFVALAMGNNVFRVKAWDSTGNVTTDSVSIVRVANPDHPVVQRGAGAADRVVPFDTTTVRIEWRVLNNLKLTSARIGELPSTAIGKSYSASVPLLVGRNLIRFEAVDSAGRSTRDSVVVVRRPDTLEPALLRGPMSFDPVGDSILVSASWVATDNHRVTSVKIQGVVVDAVGTVYGRKFMLPSSQIWVRVSAADSTGNIANDSVAIHRGTDSLAPVAHRGLGAVSRSVPQDTSSILVSWNVVDDQKLSFVTIGGDTVPGAGSAYGKFVALAFGSNRIAMRAVDLAGNETRDSLLVQRLDSSAPLLRKLSPSTDTTVSETVDSIALAIGASDNSGAATVALDGATLVSDGTLYLKKVKLAFGRNRFEIKVVDPSGNISRDSFVVTRPDHTAPTVLRGSPLADTAVSDATDSVMVSWSIVDNSSLATVAVNGALVSSASGSYSRKIGLSYGQNLVRLVAVDAFGNQRKDSVRVTRLDQTKPVISRVMPLRDTMIDAFAGTSYISFKVTDNRKLATVKVNGVLFSGAGDMYSGTMNLGLGKTQVVVLATDSAGNQASDTVVFVKGRPAIAAGGYFGLYLDSSGKVTPWGTTRVPAGLANVVAIAAGDEFSIALLQDGSVKIWDTIATAKTVPTAMTNVRRIAAGYNSAIAIKADSSVVLYGGMASTPVPTGLKAIQASVGDGFYMVVKPDSTVIVVGTGATAAATPADLGKVKSVYASHGLAGAIRVDGTLVTWGALSATGSQNTTRPLDSTGMSAFAPGYFHAFGLKASGSLVAWGYNGYGQGQIPANAPTDFVAIAVGYRYNVGLRANGLVYAWGERNYGASVTPASITSP